MLEAYLRFEFSIRSHMICLWKVSEMRSILEFESLSTEISLWPGREVLALTSYETSLAVIVGSLRATAMTVK